MHVRVAVVVGCVRDHRCTTMATPKRSAAKKTTKSASKSQSAKAGLIFPVGRIGRLLRKGQYARRVGASAAVYLAAVLEYLSAELLELTTKAVVEKKAKRLTPRAMTLAVRADDDLGELLQAVTLSRGGVVPSVDKASKKAGKKAGKKAKKSQKA
jgi:histone H2A